MKNESTGAAVTLLGCGCIALLAKLAFLVMVFYGVYYFVFHVMPAWVA